MKGEGEGEGEGCRPDSGRQGRGARLAASWGFRAPASAPSQFPAAWCRRRPLSAFRAVFATMEGAGLTAYEVARQERLEENKRRMEELGLTKVRHSTRS